jgi:hypothetical protein
MTHFSCRTRDRWIHPWSMTPRSIYAAKSNRSCGDWLFCRLCDCYTCQGRRSPSGREGSHLHIFDHGVVDQAGFLPLLSDMDDSRGQSSVKGQHTRCLHSSSLSRSVHATKRNSIQSAHVHHVSPSQQVFATLTGTAGFWFASFLWGFIVLLPHSMSSFATTQAPMGLDGAIFTGSALLGFIVESVADWQKVSLSCGCAF